MAQTHILTGAGTSQPSIRRIGPSDLKEALAKGWADFSAMPTHAIFLCVVYPVIGILLAAFTLGYSILPLLFPLAAGFALLGPLTAIGIYELSRRREAGLDASATDAFDVLRSRSIGAILVLGAMLMVIFLIWLATAHAIYVTNFGYARPTSIGEFANEVLNTSAGWNLIIVGNVVGFLFAVVVLVISVVSFPLLVDRDVGAAVAISTSVRAVVANPVTMALWGLIVAVLLFLGSLPLFLGLPVVLPVLGHATWHLYRRVVDAERSPPAEHRPEPTGRSAADFPANLFPAREEPPKQ
jgi:uncharacterized membrane protein